MYTCANVICIKLLLTYLLTRGVIEAKANKTGMMFKTFYEVRTVSSLQRTDTKIHSTYVLTD